MRCVLYTHHVWQNLLLSGAIKQWNVKEIPKGGGLLLSPRDDNCGKSDLSDDHHGKNNSIKSFKMFNFTLRFNFWQ